MKNKKYRKNGSVTVNLTALKNKVVDLFCTCSLPVRRKIFFSTILFIGIFFASIVLINQDFTSLQKETPVVTFDITTAAVAPSKMSVISVPSGTIKANPFLPYKEISTSSSQVDVPKGNIVEPPTTLGEDPDAVRVMDTIVSGILYDKFSPSAILNIEGNDYLVKKGDVVNNYNVLAITQDSVTVKLGANTYKAGIGQILTEGSLNHNDVSNLNNKFGGDK